MEMTIGNARIGSAFGKIELTVDNIKSLEESLKNRGTDWVLLSPDGELWRAKPERWITKQLALSGCKRY